MNLLAEFHAGAGVRQDFTALAGAAGQIVGRNDTRVATAGKSLAAPYRVLTSGLRPHFRYGIAITPASIRR